MLQTHVALLFASLNHYFQSSLGLTYNSEYLFRSPCCLTPHCLRQFAR